MSVEVTLPKVIDLLRHTIRQKQAVHDSIVITYDLQDAVTKVMLEASIVELNMILKDLEAIK